MPITFKRAGQEAVTLDNLSFKGVALDKVTFKKAGQEAVTVFEKAPATKTLAAGTYKWIDTPALSGFPSVTEYSLSFTSNDKTFSEIWLSSVASDQQGVGYMPLISGINFAGYSNNLSQWGYYDEDDSWHTVAAHQTITLATDQQVSADFYEWAITGGNLVKQATGETWVLNRTSTKWGTHSFRANFTSNNENFTAIQTNYPAMGDENFIVYFATTEFTPALNSAGEWTNQAYRTLTFDTAPTGDLLTWLQANGKQRT